MSESIFGGMLSLVLILGLLAVAILFLMLVTGGIKDAGTILGWTISRA